MFYKIFPTLISVFDDLLTREDLFYLKNKTDEIELIIPTGGSNWNSSVYNTSNTYNLNKDKNFDVLNNVVTDKVNYHSTEFGIKETFYSSISWFNTYYEKDYQEFHIHPNSIFSAVYFVRAPKGSSNLVLQNPSTVSKMFMPQDMMCNDDNSDLWNIPAVENRLVIFPSYISHMVPAHKLMEKRTTVAYNYICDYKI